MTNVFFPEEQISADDLYFVCYMIERVARKLKQPNKYVTNAMGHDELAKKLSLADTLHSENPQAVESAWIDEYNLKTGNYDVTEVDNTLCSKFLRLSKLGKSIKDLFSTPNNLEKIMQMQSLEYIIIPFAK